MITKEYSKCGRTFSREEIELIIGIVQENYHTCRCEISRKVCAELSWYSENGKPKEWICREFLIRLEKDNLITLPPPKPQSFSRFKKKKLERFVFKEPQKVFEGNLSNFNKPFFKKVDSPSENTFWEYLVHKYHYLSYKGVMGRFVKYIIYLPPRDNSLTLTGSSAVKSSLDGIPIACIGWTGAALRVRARDSFLGWDDTTRRNNLKHIANNFRFVIFPWVHIKYLASHILGRSVDLLASDWKAQYNVEIHLLETFVEKGRFAGTIYKAANWKLVGSTKGYAKTKKAYTKHGVIKDVYIYPLKANSLSALRDNSLTPTGLSAGLSAIPPFGPEDRKTEGQSGISLELLKNASS